MRRLLVLVCLFAAAPLDAQENADSGQEPAASVAVSAERLSRWLERLPSGAIARLDPLRDGAETLWQSAEDFARTGGLVPYELGSVVQRVRMLTEAEFNGERAALLTEALRQYAQELLLRMRTPGALGELSLQEGGPYPAGGLSQIRQSYRVGDAAMEPGSGFLLASHWLTGNRLQVDDPKGENFVSARASRAGVTLVPGQVFRGGIHGGFRSAEPLVFLEVSGGRLQPGDRVEFAYGDRSRGGPGLRLPTQAGATLQLPVYVRLVPGGGYYSLALQPVAIEPGAAASVEGLLPSIAAPGERLTLAVVTRDRFGNAVSGRSPSYELLHDGVFKQRIAENRGGLSLVQGIAFDAPGVWRYELRSSGGGVRGVTNPVQVREQNGMRVYWGNLHAHSELSDGVGTAEAYFRSADEEDQLQFVALPEHDRWLDPWKWERLRSIVQRGQEGKGAVPLLGFEWSAPILRGGHQQVLFRDASRAVPVFSQEVRDLSGLYESLRASAPAADVLVTATGHIPGEWRFADPQLLALVEIASSLGTFEWLGDYYAAHGYRVGFSAASADHAGRAFVEGFGGLTAVLAATGDRDALFRALKARHTYATSGARMLLDFRLNDGMMGDRVPVDPRRWIRGSVAGTAPIAEIALFRNGRLLSRERVDRASAGWAAGGTLDVAVEFSSDSAPYLELRDLPRQEREWLGFLQATGCEELALVDGRSSATGLALNGAARNRADFLVHTRGSTRGFVVRLRGVGEALALDLYVRRGHEDGDETPLTRPPAETPPVRQQISLAELLRGEVVRRVNVNGYNDEITVRLVDPAPPFDRTFERVDEQEPLPGDWYRVRVRQVDGHTAWSSPIWVGGEDLH